MKRQNNNDNVQKTPKGQNKTDNSQNKGKGSNRSNKEKSQSQGSGKKEETTKTPNKTNTPPSNGKPKSNQKPNSQGGGQKSGNGGSIRKRDASLLSLYSMAAQKAGVICDKADIKKLIAKLGDYGQDDKTKEFDTYQLFVCSNIWCNLWTDILQRPAVELKLYLVQVGMATAVKSAQNARQYLLSGGKSGSCDHIFKFVEAEVAGLKAMGATTFSAKRFKNLNTLLGFPRRLRLKAVDTDATELFNTTNKVCETWYDSHHIHDVVMNVNGTRLVDQPRVTYIVEAVARELGKIFKSYKRDESLFRLPPGKSAEGFNTYYEKFVEVLQCAQWIRDNGFSAPFYWPFDQHEPLSYNKFSTVPKDMYKGRGVAPEPVVKQVLGYQVASGMKKCLKVNNVDLNDQTINFEVSKFFFLATEDLSSASDLLAVDMIRALLKYCPNTLKHDLEVIRSSKTKVGGRVVINHHFSTMGAATTFALLSAVCLACARVATWLGNFGTVMSMIDDNPNAFDIPIKPRKSRLKGLQKVADECYEDEQSRWVRIYGDDTIVLDCYAETLVDVYSAIGLSVNWDKSYFTKDGEWAWYRESCGAEWFSMNTLGSEPESFDVRGVYMPRSLGQVPFAEVVALQHRLREYHNTNLFLIQAAMDLYPNCTYSESGSTYQDIWQDYGIDPELAGSSPYAQFQYDVSFWLTEEGTVVAGTEEKASFESAEEAADWLIRKDKQAHAVCLNAYGVPLVDNRKSCCQVKRVLRRIHKDTVDVCLHTTIGSRQPHHPRNEEERRLAEYCLYLLTIGNGIKHLEFSGLDYLDPKKVVRDINDLFGDRIITIENQKYLL